ncbi:hypothetical protein [Gordonia aurantiaca]|uniref:hypothetical protein n=1 Tax=Gordonia sp. B21 TaxID=3151852 RepID=UPI0032655FE2
MSATPSTIPAARAARRELIEALEDLHDLEVEAGLRRPVPRRRWLRPLALAIVAIALAVFAVLAWNDARDAYTDADFERAAAERVSVLIAPDHRDPRRAQKILAGATGAFHDEFAQSADAYTTFVREQGTASSSSVDGTGVSARRGDTATVLVAATVVFDGDEANGDGERARRFRLRVLVEPDDGTLKLAAVQYLP